MTGPIIDDPSSVVESSPAATSAEGTAPETNLTPGQLLFWFASQLQRGVQLYFDRATTVFTLRGALDEHCFDLAFSRLLEHCDILRTRIVEVSGLPQRWVGKAHPDPLEHLDFSATTDPDAALRDWIAERAPREIDLTDRPFDAALIRLAAERFVWFFNVHHIAADAGSLQTIVRHLSELYTHALVGRLDEVGPLPSFEEHAARERRNRASERYDRARLYWEEKLARETGWNPFYRRPGAPFTTRTERLSFELGLAASDRVREIAAESGLFSVSIVFMTALFALLYRTHGDRRLRIGTSFANRPFELKDVVGLMMNTCPLDVEVRENETFRSLHSKVQKEVVESSRHQHFAVRNPVEDRAYNVYINYQTMSYRELCGLPVTFDLVSSDHSNDHLNLQVSDFSGSGSFRIDLDFNRTAFSAPERERTLGHFRNLLGSLLGDSAGHLANAPLLSPAELTQLQGWNKAAAATAAERPRSTFLELIAEQVAEHPDAPAASFRGERLSYRDLDLRAARLAGSLARAGAGPEVVVGLLAERGLDFLAALLAILRTGGVYLPLDPDHPPERLAQVLAKSGAPLVLLAERQRLKLEEVLALLPPGGEIPTLLPIEGLLEATPPPAAKPSLSGLAYTLFTSGSTGVPKGAMVEPSGLQNHLWAKIETLGMTAADVLAQNASQSFDISVWQMLAALAVGGRVHVIADEVALDAARLLKETAAEGVTVLEVVPSLLAVLLDAAVRRSGGPPELPELRWLVPTGEALPPELCRRWLDLYPHVPMLNAYGPTECSDDVTHHPILMPPGAERSTIPIGRPIPYAEIYIADRDLALLPVGLPGELCVGGVPVGRGYLREPAKTAEAFVPDSWSGRPGARIYRTGDLARFTEDGASEFLGRIDHQVKIRGFRIELGEIESVLAEFPGVREVVLLAREDHPTDRRLVAYYVPEPEWGPTTAQLRGYVQAKLPEYMVPAAFVALQAMPLTANGKVDRRALPAPDTTGGSPAAPTAPRTPLEALLATICSQVLHRELISVHDNFFHIGGNSLLATQVVTMLQEILPVELELRQIFEGPTVAKLAEAIESGRSEMGEQELAVMAEILADFEQTLAG